MTAHAPQTQPEPITAEPPQRPSKTARNIVAGLVLVHLVVSVSYANLYFILLRSGFLALWHPSVSVAASACLSVAAVRLVASGSGNRLFALAALGFALSAAAWGLETSWAVFSVLSAAVAIVGWWVAARSTPGQSQRI